MPWAVTSHSLGARQPLKSIILPQTHGQQEHPNRQLDTSALPGLSTRNSTPREGLPHRISTGAWKFTQLCAPKRWENRKRLRIKDRLFVKPPRCRGACPHAQSVGVLRL